MYMFPIAAGLMAGEGLGGVVGAILAVANVDGSSESSCIVPRSIGLWLRLMNCFFEQYTARLWAALILRSVVERCCMLCYLML